MAVTAAAVRDEKGRTVQKHNTHSVCHPHAKTISSLAVVPQSNPATPPNDPAWNLMIVDDDRSAADFSSTVLRKEGYTVRTAYSGVEALNYMREQAIDLVLVDMVMPGMDGMQFLANAQELYPDTDVIVITSFGAIENAVEAMRRGAADFLPKPYRPRDLRRLTAAVLRAKHEDREEAFRAQSTAMLELAYLLTRTADVHALPTQAANLVRQNFAADAVIILLRGAADELSVLAHSGGVLSEWSRTEKIEAQGRQAITQGKLILSADSETGDCYAYAPLVAAGEPCGVLCLRRENGPWFHGKSAELLEVFAAHLALSLETAKLYNRASQQVAELEELTNVSRSLSLDTNSERICLQLLESAQHLTSAEICAVLIEQDGVQQTLTLPQLPADSPILAAVTSKLLAIRTGTGITGPQPAEAQPLMSSFLSAPMEMRGRNYGLVAAFSSRTANFTMENTRRLTALATHAAAGLANASSMGRMSAMYYETIEMIGSLVDSTNHYTLGHSRKVRTYAGALAQALGLTAEEICAIKDGALLHDIGKLCIPSDLLDKPDALTAEEFAIVASHPIHGANMFQHSPHLQNTIPIVRHHHEHYDGSGYPNGLRSEDIPAGARIVALADAFDALVTKRTYRPALSVDTARTMIAERAGSQFDPEFAKVFLNLPLDELFNR